MSTKLSKNGKRKRPVFESPEYIRDSAKFLKMIGITGVKRPFQPIIEDHYIKFNSDSGISDAEQGRQFELWLWTKKFQYERLSERGFKLSSRAVNHIIKLSDEFDLEEYGITNEDW